MRVLVIEDDERMAALLEQGLREDGHAVDVVHHGLDGVWMATENRYGAILLDAMLPGLDGYEVCRRLRSEGCSAPVLFLTARTQVADRVRGLDAGADDYLVKPFDFDELSARLRALVRRGAAVRHPVLEVGDLRLDPAEHRAWRGSEQLDLSAKEFALLQLFLEHPGEVLSRSRVLENLWDFAFDGVSNIVDQYVARLRRKIGDSNGNRIETVRGSGYRMRGEPTDETGASMSTAPPPERTEA